jgi:hypothetical protein
MQALDKILASRQKAIPDYTRTEEDGHIIYRRHESGGNVRTLKVWSYENCERQLLKAQVEGKLHQAFCQLSLNAGQYARSKDPILWPWFSECFARIEEVYDRLFPASPESEIFGVVAPDDTIEEFGS